MLLLAAGMLGCGRQQQPRHIVILPDVSGSIDRQALEQAFKAIDELVEHLQRGDRIAIIPILGDAQAEASGRIIRFEVPKERQAYDSDLRDFRRKLRISLAQMQANAVAHPGSKSDILGSIKLAEEEFQRSNDQSKRTLLVLSDFIQEDNGVNFRTDKNLASAIAARRFAVQMTYKSVSHVEIARIQLGLLRSKEYIRLDKERRGAIQEFWLIYLKGLGRKLTFVTDGAFLLQEQVL
jgi:hypothetical protein